MEQACVMQFVRKIFKTQVLQNSGATDPSNKLDISPSSASNCSLRWKVRIHDKPLVSSPGTKPTSFSRLINISRNLNDLVKPSLGFWSPGMCSSKRRFFFTSICIYFARSSMWRTRRSSPSMELILMAAVASFLKTNWYVPVVHWGVPKMVSGIPSKMDSSNMPNDTNSFEFSVIAHNSASALLNAGHSCFLENTLMQQPSNIKTPPDTEATFQDASQKPTTLRGPTLGDPSGEGMICTRWRRVNNQRNSARKHASAAPDGFDWNRARYETEKHKSALDKAAHANCPRTLRYRASPSAVRGVSSPCFSRSL